MHLSVFETRKGYHQIFFKSNFLGKWYHPPPPRPFPPILTSDNFVSLRVHNFSLVVHTSAFEVLRDCVLLNGDFQGGRLAFQNPFPLKTCNDTYNSVAPNF